MMRECNVCDMPQETRLALTIKAEQFQLEYLPEYWCATDPLPPKKFRDACVVISSLTGLVIKLLEEDIEL